MGRVLDFPRRVQETEPVPAAPPPPSQSIAVDLAWDAVRRLRARLAIAWSVAGILAAALAALAALMLVRG